MGKAREDLKVLIVDDDEKSLKLLEVKLNEAGFKNILKANDGKECLVLARTEMPDLILLDIMMPGMDGASVRSKLRDNETTKNIPVIFSTVMVSDEEIENMGGEIGGSLYIAKPYDTKKIEQAIHAALGNI